VQPITKTILTAAIWVLTGIPGVKLNASPQITRIESVNEVGYRFLNQFEETVISNFTRTIGGNDDGTKVESISLVGCSLEKVWNVGVGCQGSTVARFRLNSTGDLLL
jgi:hypothetical protein